MAEKSVAANLFQVMPPLTADEYAELKEDISERGVMVPIEYDETGNILDGHHRVAIWNELTQAGIELPPFPRAIRYGMSDPEKRTHARKLNLARRHLNQEQRRNMIQQELKENPEKSNRQIAEELRVDDKTVGAVRDELESTAEIPQLPQTIGKDGKKRETSKKPPKKNKGGRPRKDKILSSADIFKIEKKKAKHRNREALLAGVEAIEGLSGDSSIEVHPGEWWNLGAHQLYCGDTSKPEFYERVPAVEFAFADPPYGADVAEWDGEFYWEHDWLIEKAPIVAVTPGIVSIFEFARKTAMPYRWSMASWIDNGMTRGALGFGNWVYVALFSHLESLHRNAQDFVKVSIVNAEGDSTGHKGQKPLALILHLLSLFTVEGTLVCDPFLGSGTTLLAAEKAKRACIGGDKSPKYCAAIIRRWEAMTGNKAERMDG